MADISPPKVLRVGIIQNNEFVEERLLRKRHPVTVGQATRNTFSVPSSAMPGQHLLFDVRAGVYHLRLRPGMSGKVAVDEQPFDLEDLKQKGLARPDGDGLAVALSERSRGRVVIGDVTFLFQFVAAPPPPSRLQLPAAIRGGLIRAMDWPFVSVLMGSFVFQVFSIAFITTRDYPEPPRGIDTLPDRFVRLLEKTDEPPKVVKDEKTDDESKEKDETKPDETEKVADTEKKAEPRKPLTEEQVRKKAERMRVAAVKNKTILKFLGTTGGDGPGTIVDTLKGGAIDVKMAEAFDGASGLEVADSDSQLRDRRTAMGAAGGTGQVAGLEDGALEAKGVGPVASGQKGGEVDVKGSVQLKRLTDDDIVGTGVLSSERIAQVVGRRKSAIKSCYEKQLRHNSKLAGKVKIQFTIEESGRVSNARVVEDTMGDALVGKCIATNIERWRFDKPDGGSVTVAFPFVFAPSN